VSGRLSGKAAVITGAASGSSAATACLFAEVAASVPFLASEPEGNLFTGQTLGPNSGDVMP
jgi:NADP-dependent 3-hydroxy acid dehydrogenase YdfG